MYCPKCSQAQSSEEMRYCSRCGFPLEVVGVVVANNGSLPPDSKTVPAKQSRRGAMATESVIVMIFAGVIAILTTLAFDWGGPLELVAKIAAIICFVVCLIGLVRFLQVFLFVKENEVGHSLPRSDFNERSERPSLPPPQAQTVLSWKRSSTTREMVERPSVTENTTRTLDEHDGR